MVEKGEANTEFFQKFSRKRMRDNHLFRLSNAGVEATPRNSMEELAAEYFSGSLGSARARDFAVDLRELDLPSFDTGCLDAPFSEEQVWNVIKELHPDKAPGLDGFTIRFYQACWPIIKVEVLCVVAAFASGDNRGMIRLNSALI